MYFVEVVRVFQEGFKGVEKIVSKVYKASFKFVSTVCEEVQRFC